MGTVEPDGGLPGTNSQPEAETSGLETAERGAGRRCLRVLAMAVPLIGAIFPPSLIFDWSAGPLARWILAAGAAALIWFHLINIFRTRVRLEHWKVDSVARLLCSEILIGCVLPAAALAGTFLLPPSSVTFVFLTLLFGLCQVLYEPLERDIREKVEAAGKSHGTEQFRQRRPLRIFGMGKSYEEMSEREHGPGLWRGLIALGKDPWQEGLSRTRSLILYFFLFCSAFSTAAAADVAMHDWIADHGHHGGSGQSSEEEGESSSSGEGEVAGALGKTAGTEVGTEVIVDSEEGQHCGARPGFGAPAWARADLYALYYGGLGLEVTPPPGTKVGGCTGRVFVPPGLEGSFVYTIGTNPAGEILSVAVDSVRFGPEIFLAPAAQQVLALIRAGVMPLGGYPRKQVGGGDIVPVTMPEGTLILVRGGTVLPGSPGYARPYLRLPVTVATLWVEAMRVVGTWLWPRAPKSAPDGSRVYTFSAALEGDPVGESVSFDPYTGTSVSGSSTVELPEPQLSDDELAGYADLAR
jgi:hypothetical protein